MTGSNRTRKWRERCAAEGKKSFTVLLTAEAQKIINSEKEKTGENYSDILERALKALNGGRLDDIRPAIPQPAAGTSKPPAVPSGSSVTRTRILIDDLENYEFKEDRIDFSYKKGPDHPGKVRKENLLKKLAKFPGKKKWFR